MAQKLLRKITASLRRHTEKKGDIVIERVSLRHGSIDILYFILGFFTHCYGATLAVLFFMNSAGQFPLAVSFADTLQELYLGGLGVYVVLKEIRKRYHREQSKHWGEYFVGAWISFFVASTTVVLISPDYHFDALYKLIVTNSLATVVIYIGGLFNRP